MAQTEKKGWKEIFRENIFKSKIFNFFLTVAVIVSVIAVILESIKSVQAKYENILVLIEWIFTILFTIEYLLRTSSAVKPAKYTFSFLGIIDLVSILPLYISLIFKGEEILQVIRLLRLIRVSSRAIRVANKLTDLTSSIFSLDRHLTSNEKVIFFFRRSRKYKLFSYIIAILLFALSLIEIVLKVIPPNYIISIFSYIILIISIIWISILEFWVLSIRYAITDKRIFYSSGILNEHFKSINYQYIIKLSLEQKVWDKLLNTGTLIIDISGGEGEELKLINISNPLQLKKIISEMANRYSKRWNY